MSLSTPNIHQLFRHIMLVRRLSNETVPHVCNMSKTKRLTMSNVNILDMLRKLSNITMGLCKKEKRFDFMSGSGFREAVKIEYGGIR